MSTKERLNVCADLLAAIDLNRARTGDPGLATSIEYGIIARELQELERDILEDPGALESQLVPLRRPDRRRQIP